MTKKLSSIQWQGHTGEKAFEFWASKLGLLATHLQPDEGIDYVCQVVGQKTEKASHKMRPDLVAAWVRGSEKKTVKIQIKRDDAEHLLKTNLPAVVILVDLAAQGEFPDMYVRVLDAEFIRELSAFLRGSKKSRTLRADACIADSEELRTALHQLLRAGTRERLDALKRELKVQAVLPGASYQTVANADRSASLVALPDFWGQFDMTSAGARSLRESAIFGRQEFFHERITQIPLRQELTSAFEDLPMPVLTGGPAFEEGATVILTAKDEHGAATAPFTMRRHGIWKGYCHSCGVSLRISDSVKRDDGWVHEMASEIDPATTVSDVLQSDIRGFLVRAKGSATIEFGGRLQLPASHFPDLNALGWLCEYLNLLGDEPCMHLSEWKAKDVQEEDLQSLRVLWELTRRDGAFDGFAFLVAPVEQKGLRPHDLDFEIPLCMNLRGKGLCCYLTARGQYLLHPSEQVAVGLRIVQTQSHAIETREVAFPTGGLPKFKVCPEWPAIPVYLEHDRSEWSGTGDWGVELRHCGTD